jgi:DNA-binding NarL/FixJ family response regulator
MSQPVRVLLVDDHAMVLEALASRLRVAPGVSEVVTASNGEEALREALKSPFDIAVLDIEVPGRSAFDLAAELLQRVRGTRVIFLSGFMSDILIEQALQVRASGYVVKGESVDAISRAIDAVSRGETYFSPQIRERLRFDLSRKSYVMDHAHPLSALTTRQIEVLRHLAVGQSVKDVAKLMHLSQKSVDSHKYRIMHKLAIHDRVELARYAIREGLTQP